MVKEIIEVTKLTASDGMILTNGEAYAKEAYLGSNDSAENWHEITMTEYEELTAEPELQ